MTPSEFREMWIRDLARAELKQQDIAAKLRERGAPITASAVSQWVAQGYPPKGRVKPLTDILGPNSEFAKISPETWSAMWAAGARAAKEARAVGVVPRTELSQPPAQDAAPSARNRDGERYVPLIVRIKEAMPIELQGNFRPNFPDRPRRHTPAYQHDGLTVEFVVLRDGPMLRLAATAALFRLAVLKRKYHNRSSQQQHMLLLVEDEQIPPAHERSFRFSDSDRLKLISELREDAYTMGLGLGFAGGTKQVANYLESRAFDMVNGDLEDMDAAELATDDDFFNQN